jgi:PAS domain S-box-containing protein
MNEVPELFSDEKQRLMHLLENLPSPLVVGTLEAIPKFVFMNREYVRLFGYEPAEVPTIAEWMPLAYPDPAYRAEILDWWFRALVDSKTDPGLVRSREVRIQTKDGRLVEAILNAIVMDHHVIVAFQDITGRKQREMELEKSNTRMQLAAEAAGAGFWEYDFETNFETMDARIRDIYGVADGEDFGEWEERLLPEDRAAVSSRLQSALDGKERGVDLEFRVVTSGGGVRWVRSRCRITRDAGGKPLRLTGIEFDITAEKEAARALEEALARSEQENEARKKFLGSVSHEIRTPLSALVALTNSMLLESEAHPLPEIFLEHLESARAGGQYLNFMLSNILDFSAIETGRAEIRATEFYVADWAEDVSSILLPIAQSHGVRLKWVLPEDANVLFRTDQFRLTQIALNLGHNAVKFSTTSNAFVSIAVSVDAEEMTLTVADNGPGIDPERLPGLFGEFAQGGSAPRPGERGIGLGLAIVKENAEMLGGSVSARPNTLMGVVFEIKLPAKKAD